MKFKFAKDLPYQTAAVDAVVDVFGLGRWHCSTVLVAAFGGSGKIVG